MFWVKNFRRDLCFILCLCDVGKAQLVGGCHHCFGIGSNCFDRQHVENRDHGSVWLNGESAKKFSHDLAGYFMIGLAAGLFASLVFYLRWLIQDAQTLEQVALRRA